MVPLSGTAGHKALYIKQWWSTHYHSVTLHFTAAGHSFRCNIVAETYLLINKDLLFLTLTHFLFVWSKLQNIDDHLTSHLLDVRLVVVLGQPWLCENEAPKCCDDSVVICDWWTMAVELMRRNPFPLPPFQQKPVMLDSPGEMMTAVVGVWLLSDRWEVSPDWLPLKSELWVFEREQPMV